MLRNVVQSTQKLKQKNLSNCSMCNGLVKYSVLVSTEMQVLVLYRFCKKKKWYGCICIQCMLSTRIILFFFQLELSEFKTGRFRHVCAAPTWPNIGHPWISNKKNGIYTHTHTHRHSSGKSGYNSKYTYWSFYVCFKRFGCLKRTQIIGILWLFNVDEIK